MTDCRRGAACAMLLFLFVVVPAHGSDRFKIFVTGSCKVPEITKTMKLVVGDDGNGIDVKYENEAWRVAWPDNLPLPLHPVASLRFDGARTNCWQAKAVPYDKGNGNMQLITFTCNQHPVTSVTVNADAALSMSWTRLLEKTRHSTHDDEVDCREPGGPVDSGATISNIRLPDETVWLELSFKPNTASLILNKLDVVKNAQPGKSTVPVSQQQIIDAICGSKVVQQDVSNCYTRAAHDETLATLKMTMTLEQQ